MELFPRNIFSFPRASKKDEEYRRKVFEIKKEILSRFSVNQLEELRLRHLKVAMGSIGIINPTKHDLVKYMASNLSLDEVVDEAERYEIEYKDLIKKLKKFKENLKSESENVKNHETKDHVVKEILEALEARKRSTKIPVKERSPEYDFREQLVRYLEGYFKNKARIEKEQLFKRNRIDVLIELDGHEVGLELKVPTKRGSLTRLEGQIERYKSELGRFIDDLIFVILDVAEVEDLNKWVEQAKKKYGVHIVVLDGKLKRRKRRRFKRRH